MEDRKMGALTAWNPFRELERIARRWESPFPRVFEDIEDNHNEAFMPAVESYVKDGNLVVRADVPGLELKDLEVSVLRNVLTIKGERNCEKEIKKEDYLRREVSYGSFERRMSLPDGAATDQVKANFKNGVLEITVPMAKEATTKKVQIESAGEKKVDISKH
jgi:HSP20 family protein